MIYLNSKGDWRAFAFLACFFTVLVLIPRGTHCQTYIPSGDVSGVWTADSSPYIIQGDIRVESSTSLIIQPGVEVLFQGQYFMRVKGNLISEGTAQDSIRFTSVDPAPNWRGLRVDSLDANADSLRFSYCSVSNLFQQGWNIQDGRVVIENSTFFNNNQLYLGAIFLFGGSQKIRNCTFKNNHSSSQSDAGAIYVSDASPIIENCEFRSNSATNAGGGISIWRWNIPVEPVIRNCLFENNEASSGAAIVLHSNVVPVIEDCVFRNNSSGFDGGAIWMGYILAGIVEFNNNVFDNNSSNQEGGAIYSVRAQANFNSCEFRSNSAGMSGGAIDFKEDVPITVEDCKFYNNSSNSSGGAVHISDHCLLTMNRCEFLNNNGGAGGGLDLTYYNEASITNCLFANNQANNGGAISLIQFCHAQFSNCTIVNNHG
ncbi:MAG: right-handed parallel beta-helix repeat-containing protein, partial [Bacteroidota bacterium]